MALDQHLEKKGAMDLIQVLGVDVQGTRADDFATGQLKSASLRVRGRLLPIVLDLNTWPEPCSRKDKMVQYWQPSVHDAPKRETFLVPVLFTKWNKKLPTATPNALLLESLKEKVSFRRIGTARLSSSCNIRYTIPHLYEANHDEDKDGSTTSDDETDPDKLSTDKDLYPRSNNRQPPRVLNPREQLHYKHMRTVSALRYQDAYTQFRERVPALSPQLDTSSPDSRE